MKKITFGMRMINGASQQCTGYAVELPAAPGYDFAAHKWNDGWRVTELATGSSVNYPPEATRKAAIAAANAQIEEVGLAKFKRIVKKRSM